MFVSIPLPSGEILESSELTVKQYKTILKSTYGEDNDLKAFLKTLCEVLANLTSKPTTFFSKDISIFELFYTLIELRNQSMGNELSLVLGEKKSLTLNLEIVQNCIKRLCNSYQNREIKSKTIILKFGLPSAAKVFEDILDERLLFLDSVEIVNKNEKFKIENFEHAKAVLEKVSAKLLMEFQKTVECFVKDLREMDFLKQYKVESKMTFAPSIDNLLWYTKLLFNEPLDTFYSNIFYLAKLGNMNPEYIESCTPGEYMFFAKQLQASLAGSSSEDNIAADNSLNDPGEHFEDSEDF